MRCSILSFLFVFLIGSVSGQFYDFGQEPPSVKWKVIKTEHYKIIFPNDFERKSQDLAQLMEKNYLKNCNQLKHQPSRIPLIIHNQTVYSNAFVTWAPKRIEFFTFPDADQYPNDWLNELSVHEYRHVIQIDKVNQGFTKGLSFILGQQATGVVAGMMPLWFIEGDAVMAETSLSSSGRGRLPSFEMPIKARLLTDEKIYSLSKAYLGSYKDNVPDYYQLGYQMVKYAQKTYGQEYWSEALNYISRHPYLISPYYFYSKKTIGGGQNILYKNAMESIKRDLTTSNASKSFEDIKSINKRNSKVYTSYIQPTFINDSSLIALKTGLDINPSFVRISLNGEEETLFVPGNLVSKRFSLSKNSIIWDEYVQDIRWTNRSYSIIREYNFVTGKKSTISHKTKYTSACFSSGGDSIVVINSDPDYTFSLVILNSSNGEVLRKIPAPGNDFLEYPVWLTGTDKIAVITVSEMGKALFTYDLKLEVWEEVFNSAYQNIDQLRSSGDLLFFNAGFDGTDNIFMFNLSDKSLSKISNSTFGAFYPDYFPEKKLISYSTYSTVGNDIKLKVLDDRTFEQYTLPDTLRDKFITIKSSNKISSENYEGFNSDSVFEVKPYRKSLNLLNLHSWAPYWFDYLDPNIDDPKVSAGVTLLSQNELSTAVFSLGYEHNQGSNYLHSGLTYKGFFPVFDIRNSYGGPAMYAPVEGIDAPETKPNNYTSISTYIPLSFPTGKISTGIQPSFRYIFNSTYYYHFSESVYKRGISFIEPRIFFYSYLRPTTREIQPRYGFTLDSKFSSSPFENEFYGNVKSIKLTVYLPGIVKNHGLKLKTEWQNQKVDSYYMQNHLSLPRGYQQAIFIDMKKISADYNFPIAYPDLSIASLLYLKRIRGNFYIDYMKGIKEYTSATETSKPLYPLSQGLELLADYHIFRFIFEISTGMRLVYLPHEDIFGAQLLFSINLDKFL